LNKDEATLKAEIIVDFVQKKADNDDFDDFFSINELGIPLAVSVEAGFCELNEQGNSVLEETYLMVLNEIGIDNINLDNAVKDLGEFLEDDEEDDEDDEDDEEDEEIPNKETYDIAEVVNKAKIIIEFVDRYADVETFDDFFSYNDFGIPLANSIKAGLCEFNEQGASILEETYFLLLTELRIENINFDKEYKDLNEVLEDSTMEDYLDEPGSELLQIALNPATSVEQLTILAQDKNDDVRRCVASNPSTPENVLKSLSLDEDRYVQSDVASNASTPSEVLFLLSENIDYYVRQGVACNPLVTKEILVKLGKDESVEVRTSVACNDLTPIETLLELTKDKNIEVLNAIASNPSIPINVLTKLLNETEEESTLKSIASNPSTPLDLLTVLANKESKEIRRAVALNPATPDDVRKISQQPPKSRSN
jgi:hypothetical protein